MFPVEKYPCGLETSAGLFVTLEYGRMLMHMAGLGSLCLDFSGENRWHHPNLNTKGTSC